jgi:predicted DNA-binding transcriptional regulator AlpA
MTKIDLDEVRLLTLRQVAELLGRSADTINQWTKLGTFPKPIQSRPGAPKQWTLATVKAWIEKRQRARYSPPSRRGQLKQYRGGGHG